MGVTALALDGGTLSGIGPAVREAGGTGFARESYLAEHLPYFALATDDVMVLREGDLLATLLPRTIALMRSSARLPQSWPKPGIRSVFTSTASLFHKT